MSTNSALMCASNTAPRSLPAFFSPPMVTVPFALASGQFSCPRSSCGHKRFDAHSVGVQQLQWRVTPTDPPYHSLAFQTENEAPGRNPNPSPTAQRASPAGIEATTTPQYRSLSLRLALSLVPFRSQPDCNSPARDDHPLASCAVPVVLARAVTQAGWQAENLGRAAQSHRRDEPCKSPLGVHHTFMVNCSSSVSQSRSQ